MGWCVVETKTTSFRQILLLAGVSVLNRRGSVIMVVLISFCDMDLILEIGLRILFCIVFLLRAAEVADCWILLN